MTTIKRVHVKQGRRAQQIADSFAFGQMMIKTKLPRCFYTEALEALGEAFEVTGQDSAEPDEYTSERQWQEWACSKYDEGMDLIDGGDRVNRSVDRAVAQQERRKRARKARVQARRDARGQDE